MSRYRVLTSTQPDAPPTVAMTTRWRWLAAFYAWVFCAVYEWGEALVQQRRAGSESP